MEEPRSPQQNTDSALPAWEVYFVRCRDNTLYAGIARDAEKRLAMHNSGQGAKYTRSRLPVTLVYRESCTDHSAALRREAALKKLTRKEKETLIAAARQKDGCTP